MNNKKWDIPSATSTYFIVVICTVCYILQCNGVLEDRLLGTIKNSIGVGQAYRIITGAFLHANIIHFLSNMICLLVVGISFETEGQVKHFIVPITFILGVIGGGVIINYCATSLSIHVGASGGIIALITAYSIYGLVHKQLAWKQVLPTIILNVAITLQSGVSWQGHIGGAMVGLILGLFYSLL